MGRLYQVWHATFDPTDATNPGGTYTPFTFVNSRQEIDSPFTRREGVVTIPDADDVLDFYARRGGKIDKRIFTVTFRVMTNKGPDAAHDLLFAAINGDRPVRLVYQTDAKALWFTTGHLESISPPLSVDRDYYIDYRVSWRIRPDWRPQYSATSGDIWGVNDGTWGVGDGLWDLLGTVTLSTDPTLFTVDATGVAGTDLPTLDDTGPIITITGPFGSTGVGGGILITNGTATYIDTDGTEKQYKITIPVQLPTNLNAVVIDCGRRTFKANGLPLTAASQRPGRNTNAQPEYFRIVAGKGNLISVGCLPGSSPLTGGTCQIDWWRKRG